jgi:hypothetical protein
MKPTARSSSCSNWWTARVWTNGLHVAHSRRRGGRYRQPDCRGT